MIVVASFYLRVDVAAPDSLGGEIRCSKMDSYESRLNLEFQQSFAAIKQQL